MSGRGTRFLKVGYKQNKALLTLLGKRVLDWVISMYPSEWRIVLGVSTEFLDSNPQFSDSLPENTSIVAVEPHASGPVPTIKKCIPACDEGPIIVSYVDFWSSYDPEKAVRQLDGVVQVALTYYTGFHPHKHGSTRYGYLRMSNDSVEAISEKKPLTDNHLLEPASSGAYLFASRAVLSELIDQVLRDPSNKTNGEFYASALISQALRNGSQCVGIQDEFFFQLGTPRDFEDCKRYLEYFAKGPSQASLLHDGRNKIVMAAGKSSRFSKNGYTTMKSALALFESTVIEEILTSLQGAKVFASRQATADIQAQAELPMSLFLRSDAATESQLESAVQISELLGEVDDGVLFAPCDALIFPAESSEIMSQTYVGFAMKPFNFMLEQPEQYGWVRRCSESGRVEKVEPRDAEDLDALVLTGHFFTRDQLSLRHVLSLHGGVREAKLDDWFFYHSENFPEHTALVEASGIFLGTPYEYETAQYYYRAMKLFQKQKR